MGLTVSTDEVISRSLRYIGFLSKAVLVGRVEVLK